MSSHNYTEIIHITTGSGASNDRESSVGFQENFGGNSNATSPSSTVHFGGYQTASQNANDPASDFSRRSATNNSFHASGANLNSGSFATAASQSAAGNPIHSQSLYNMNNQSYAASASNFNYNGGGGSPTTPYTSQANYASSLMNASSAHLGLAGGDSGNGLSSVEAAILRSRNPIDVNETEEITVLGQRGIWANKSEVMNWRGPIPITEYQINEDPNPEVITKQSDQSLVYVQELAIRYLRPPTPPAPGEIVIKQEANTVAPPAVPIVLRQQPPRPDTPEPLVIREAPPMPPGQVGRKVITISGKRIPPPPRKVVIERLAPLPSKPQSVIIERWLPYGELKRRVIFSKCTEKDPVVVKPKNVIVQWEAPKVQIKKEIKYLGVIRANPSEYVSRYGSSLRVARDLPEFVREIPAPQGVTLAADYKYSDMPELEGDVQALSLVDLDREGLSEYRSQLQRLGISSASAYNTGAQSVLNNVAEQSFGNSMVGSNLNFGAPSASNIAKSSSYFQTSGPTFSTNQNLTSNTAASGQFGSGQFSSILHTTDRASAISNQVLGNSYGLGNSSGVNSQHQQQQQHHHSNQGRASAVSFHGGPSSATISNIQGFNQTSSYQNTSNYNSNTNSNSSNYNNSSSNYNNSSNFNNNSVNYNTGNSSPFANLKPAGGLTQNYSLSSSIPLVNVNSFLNDVFAQVDKDRNGKITLEEAEKVLLRINSRLGRSYGEDEVKAFFLALDTNRDGIIDLHEFQCAFERLL